MYMFGKQSYRIARCAGKVDVIVTDSPLPLSIHYNSDPRLTDNFNLTVMDVFNSYNNICYFFRRYICIFKCFYRSNKIFHYKPLLTICKKVKVVNEFLLLNNLVIPLDY